jgi:hypothetical protein
MNAQAQVWFLPDEQKILISDLVGIVPLELVQPCTQTPAIGYPPDCHLGRFATWQEALEMARQKAAETGFPVIEERYLAWEVGNLDWLKQEPHQECDKYDPQLSFL